MSTLANIKYVNGLYNRFRGLKRLDDLALMLGSSVQTVFERTINPHYECFEVFKKNGSKRKIENPEPQIKQWQGVLNEHLQAAYFFNMTEAAHGFVINPNKKAYSRNILTNAQQHLGAAWLLNTDMKDFFHYISTEMVKEVMLNPPFRFSEELGSIIAQICTNRGRLPMGAPTSPVLSNWAFIGADHDLTAIAKEKGWNYTRYADDMSFSSDSEIHLEDVQLIRNLLAHRGFELNEDKVKLFGPDEQKEVTGLLLGKKDIELKDEFTLLLRKEIEKLAHIVAVNHRLEKERTPWVIKYQQQIEGKINFVEQILGGGAPVYQQILGAYLKALNPPDEYEAMNWLDFDYF
jgi:RNA-directed DNA polymerase